MFKKNKNKTTQKKGKKLLTVGVERVRVAHYPLRHDD